MKGTISHRDPFLAHIQQQLGKSSSKPRIYSASGLEASSQLGNK
nr:hypothetical protein [Bacillus altitudinis]